MPEEEIKIGNIFEDASNFEELFKILRDEEEIEGKSGKTYTAKYLINLINQIRDRLKKLQQKTKIKEVSERAIKQVFQSDLKLMEKICAITREEELRFKVLELVIKEAVARGVSKETIPDLNQDTLIIIAEKQDKEENNGNGN